VADRLILGHWEADLTKGAMNRSSVGTLVEHTTLMVVLAKMPDGAAVSIPPNLRLGADCLPLVQLTCSP